MSEILEVGPTGNISNYSGYGLTDIARTAIPTANEPGYAHGCICRLVNGTGATDAIYMNIGTLAACNFQSLLSAADLALASTTALTLSAATYLAIKLNSIEAIRVDDAAITLTAAANTAGANAFISTQGGGVATTTGKNGGSLTITAGSGSADGDSSSAGGSGGTIALVAGNGQGVDAPGGNGGCLTLTAGQAAAIGGSGLDGFIQNKSLELHAQGAPGTLNSTGTLTAALIKTGIVTSTTGAGVTATLDTGSAMDGAFNTTAVGTDSGFFWTAINTGANAFTVTAAANHTIVGAGAVAAGTSGSFFSRRTAATTWITYRL